jgi:hypothetical protein
MITIDEARDSFAQFQKEFQKYLDIDLGESDTRSKVIDSLLMSVLGWSETDIVREENTKAGYFDYKVSIPGFAFLIEAKRKQREFSIPTNHKKSSIKSLYKENGEVINQIRGYCVEAGVQYGIVTNGRQFICLKLINIDNKSWLDNQCLLFNGFDDIDNRFMQFYDNLSKPGIISSGGFKYDVLGNVSESNTVISTLLAREKELIRNLLSSRIAPIINRIFGEMFTEEQEDDTEFIRQCFVQNEEIIKNREEIERLFADRAPQVSSVVPAVNTASLNKQIADEIRFDNISIKNLVPPNPIIIIGSKGAGKTTFINHLFRHHLSEDDIKDHLPIYLDLRKFFDKHDHFRANKVAKEIVEILYEGYSGLELHSLGVLIRVYLQQIKRNDESIWAHDKEHNPDTYNERLSDFVEKAQNDSMDHLEHLNKYLIRERRLRLIVIIDNADQFDQPIQSEVFIFAHSLARKAFCGTVVSLREGYYYKWRNSPPFDAYESNVYHVTAPRYSEVLQRRIDYTLERIDVARNALVSEGPGSKSEITNQEIIEFLSGLRNSLFSESNSSIIDFLNYTTYPNIREGLKTFKLFLTSGYTNTPDYIVRERFRIEGQSSPQVIPVHEFVRSIGLQNRLYYSSEVSILHNFFIPPIDSDDHFIKLYIIEDLANLLDKKGPSGKYVLAKDLIDKFSSFGYRLNVINASLFDLVKLGMLDTDEQITDIDWKALPKDCNMAVTSKGYFYFKSLVNRFYYLDLVLQDTPIFDKHSFDEIKNGFPLANEKGKRFLYDRIETARRFLAYLALMEKKQPRQLISAYGSLSEYLNKGFDADVSRIEANVDPQELKK